MKGSEKVIQKLNELLAEELTAVNQYMVHSEMCENWNYERLHKMDRARAFTEMVHAEKLIERLLFLEGRPNVSTLQTIRIGEEVEAQHKNDLALEISAVKAYNEAIKIAVGEGDNGTRDLLNSILREEEEHLDELEAQLDQINQMGKPIYLAQQIRPKD
ncbi:MAG: bacterioferritin [Desulfobacteraceae bacterium]|nr:MAG: bacterioferritin [Desulfobacteraceae bacterium]